MRSRAPARLLALLLGLLLFPASALAANPDSMLPYATTVDGDGAATLADAGIDVAETGYVPGNGAQEVQVVLTGGEVAKLERKGLDFTPLALDQPTKKSKALGQSPNQFFNVYRSYMEPGGIKDQMIALADANPDVMKLEQIGTSLLNKPIYVIKMTENARSVPDGTRPALLFSAVNHAREWIAAEMGRRLPIWFAEHKNDPKIRALLQTREIWFEPIQNPDGYDYTFTCGVGWENAKECDYRTAVANPYGGTSATVINRYWRKTVRDNNNNGVHGDPSSGGQGDGVDPNRNYPAKRGIDEEGASDQTGAETYRGPYAL